MARKAEEVVQRKPLREPPRDEGLPPWMATFADMMTLLLCFFVLLLSFAEQSEEKYRDALGSLKGAFGVRELRTVSDDMAPFNTSQSSKELMAKISTDERLLLGVVMRIKSLMEDEDIKLKEGTGVAADRDGVIFSADSAMLFAPGTADLAADADTVLDKVVTVLKDYNLSLVVRGHTDDRPISTLKFPSNWELSSARAAVALDYILRESGIGISRAKAVGYADTRPAAPNDSDENRLKNQRVEFYLHMPQRDAW
ncbi:MAG: OmpA family protein [Pseudodesulfovibrio sp.]|uniref:OmpA/MotB domain protein n=1 Tax=Pseudodesulfovibrio aespoeensis (strain ATCC 700646 / DSM 10631 / Aspo-2) TaxID=643562 RepID=E6VXX8_PSEA9|nr:MULTISPECIES: flagellar motor protein MotB [Pseudodesulfovibrio]MBU4191924.1 OmpA family protein [Pseudomonadota bacterium]ADU62685.1 OmpA/MotB domain protein [Pseudodesulfovibrio aespoeensis Aspo-2]MBU4380013.1 OmpA family protein [Pseudomonadota bacterium]MBU4474340.1 OmpA family protein [Pseudomonadota bacterium]MBU4515622.1 OmpA family protein [Pseudomonadota bacterium]